MTPYQKINEDKTFLSCVFTFSLLCSLNFKPSELGFASNDGLAFIVISAEGKREILLVCHLQEDETKLTKDEMIEKIKNLFSLWKTLSKTDQKRLVEAENKKHINKRLKELLLILDEMGFIRHRNFIADVRGFN